MDTIDTFYLIDYENVGSDGLTGCDKLKKSDHIIIFFTKNAMRINMSDIANHGDALLDMIEVPAGKQSADIHIGSYLGYLIGIYKEKDCSVIIVSKDSDFDNVIKFWKSKTGVKISRIKQIKDSNIKAVPTKKSASTSQNTDKSDSRKKSMLNQVIIQKLSKAGFDNDIVGYVASTVVKNVGIKDRKQKIYRVVVAKYGQAKGTNIYNHIKKEL